MRIVVRLFRVFLFFALFAFALNNTQDVTVNWFFGHSWTAPLVIVVLVAFGGGSALGVLAMVPAWWRHRRHAKRSSDNSGAAAPLNSELPPNPHVPGDGL